MKTIGNIIHKNTFPLYIFGNTGMLIYWQYTDGYWGKRIYDSNGNQIYFENSDGYVEDNRP